MVDPKNLKYRNITISGLPGAGSSTLGKSTEKILGWKYFSGGDFMRDYAIKSGSFDKNTKVHHDATAYGDEFDQKVDFKTREILEKNQGKIIEAWLSGFMAQKVKGVLKVLLFCSKDSLRIDRVVNRDRISVEKAKKHIFEREEYNLNKWTRMYAKQWQEWVKGEVKKARRGKYFDFFHPGLYDLTIDTFSHDREATLKQILAALGYKKD